MAAARVRNVDTLPAAPYIALW